MKQVYLKTRSEWRNWLAENHRDSSGIWLVFQKKHTGKATLLYDDAVEEALCFGWIDSIIKRIDDDKYVRKFTPRNPDSRWSKSNKTRVRELIRQGLMTDAGLALVDRAKASGQWTASPGPAIPPVIPEELADALAKNKKAKLYFDQLAPTYRKHFIGWIAAAKRQETRARRVSESIGLLEQGKKLGMK